MATFAPPDLAVFVEVEATPDRNQRPSTIGRVAVLDEGIGTIAAFESPALAAALWNARWGRDLSALTTEATLYVVADNRRRLLRLSLRSGEVSDFAEVERLVFAGALISSVRYHSRARELDVIVSIPPPDKAQRTTYDLLRLGEDGTVKVRRPLGEMFLGPYVERSPDGAFDIAAGTYRFEYVAGGDNEDWIYTDLRRAGAVEPVFRARSAYLHYGDGLLYRRWLADSSGYVAQVQRAGTLATTKQWLEGRRYAVIGHDGSVRELDLGPVAWGDGPVPAPDNPNLVSIGRRGFRNLLTGDAVRAELTKDLPGHLDPWGLGSAEIRFTLPHGGHGGAGALTLLPVNIERPPLSASPRFAIARAGDCVNLRAQPAVAAPVLDCLPDGTRLDLSPAPPPPGFLWPDHDLVAMDWRDDQAFIRVQTPRGTEGWVAMQYLDWATVRG